MLSNNIVQHTIRVQFNSCWMSLSTLWINSLEPEAILRLFANSTKEWERTASAATLIQQSCLNLFMVAEQWSWKHPGELQQAEGLIPEHWGTLNNSWSNKG